MTSENPFVYTEQDKLNIRYCMYQDKYYKYVHSSNISNYIKPVYPNEYTEDINKLIKAIEKNGITYTFVVSGLCQPYIESHALIKLLIYSVDPDILHFKNKCIKLTKVITDTEKLDQVVHVVQQLCTINNIEYDTNSEPQVCDLCYEERELVHLRCCKNKYICELCFKPLKPCRFCEKNIKI